MSEDPTQNQSAQTTGETATANKKARVKSKFEQQLDIYYPWFWSILIPGTLYANWDNDSRASDELHSAQRILAILACAVVFLLLLPPSARYLERASGGRIGRWSRWAMTFFLIASWSAFSDRQVAAEVDERKAVAEQAQAAKARRDADAAEQAAQAAREARDLKRADEERATPSFARSRRTACQAYTGAENQIRQSAVFASFKESIPREGFALEGVEGRLTSIETPPGGAYVIVTVRFPWGETENGLLSLFGDDGKWNHIAKGSKLYEVVASLRQGQTVRVWASKVFPDEGVVENDLVCERDWKVRFDRIEPL